MFYIFQFLTVSAITCFPYTSLRTIIWIRNKGGYCLMSIVKFYTLSVLIRWHELGFTVYGCRELWTNVMLMWEDQYRLCILITYFKYLAFVVSALPEVNHNKTSGLHGVCDDLLEDCPLHCHVLRVSGR